MRKVLFGTWQQIVLYLIFLFTLVLVDQKVIGFAPLILVSYVAGLVYLAHRKEIREFHKELDKFFAER